jgi:lipopolysaccharide biosynthesis regulator YciM
MYEELIGALKKCGYPGDVHYCRDCFLSDSGMTCRMKKLLPAAADAIEELSKKRVGTWHRVKATQRSYSFVCNSCGFMYPYLTRCCPNCGVEYIDEEPPKEET